MLSSASVNMNPAFQTWIQLRTLCGASPWTYRFSQHLCFSSEVECNVLGGGEGGEKKKKHYTGFIDVYNLVLPEMTQQVQFHQK